MLRRPNLLSGPTNLVRKHPNSVLVLMVVLILLNLLSLWQHISLRQSFDDLNVGRSQTNIHHDSWFPSFSASQTLSARDIQETAEAALRRDRGASDRENYRHSSDGDSSHHHLDNHHPNLASLHDADRKHSSSSPLDLSDLSEEDAVRLLRALQKTKAYSHFEESLSVRSFPPHSPVLSTAHVLNAPIISKQFPPVKKLNILQKKRILVTGGAGFVGSHLTDRLMTQGHEVIVVDNLFTGRRDNIQHWVGHPNFAFYEHDVVEDFMAEVHQIYHLACPASPPHYQYNPIKTVKTSMLGTLKMAGLAKRVRARMLFTSTSEVYGDPLEHPQRESYWGNVNTMGPRACYDEGKRVGETICYSYRTELGVEMRIARIFNTFGPRMHPNDGRVVSNFIISALKGEPLTIYGDGSTTRSFQYVDDLVDGLVLLMNSDEVRPVNLGNPDETSIGAFALKVKAMVGSESEITHVAAPTDDPKKRKPDISRARASLNWQPRVHVDEGLQHTIDYFKELLEL